MEAPCLWDRALYDERAASEASGLNRGPKRMTVATAQKSQQCKSCKRIVSNAAQPCPGCGYWDGHGFVSGTGTGFMPF